MTVVFSGCIMMYHDVFIVVWCTDDATNDGFIISPGISRLTRRAGGLFGCCMAPAIADRTEDPGDPGVTVRHSEMHLIHVMVPWWWWWYVSIGTNLNTPWLRFIFRYWRIGEQTTVSINYMIFYATIVSKCFEDSARLFMKLIHPVQIVTNWKAQTYGNCPIQTVDLAFFR